MNEQFSRTISLLGQDGLDKIKNTTVAIFGIGGVGGYVCEGLARSGVEKFYLIDNDVVSISNINRQIIATHDTIGLDKVEAMKNRILSINPKANVETYKTFFLPENSSQFDFSKFDYVVDCVDTVSAKIEIIKKAKETGCRVISSMGTGNKIDPTKFEVCDISKTKICPLARVMRTELKKRGISEVTVVYSTELPYKINLQEDNTIKKSIPASSSFVPPVCGMVIASWVVRDIIGN